MKVHVIPIKFTGVCTLVVNAENYDEAIKMCSDIISRRVGGDFKGFKNVATMDLLIDHDTLEVWREEDEELERDINGWKGDEL